MGARGSRRWAARYSVGLTAAITLSAQGCGGGLTHNSNGGDAGTSGQVAGRMSGGTSGSGNEGAAAGTLSLGGISTGGSINIPPNACAEEPTLFKDQALGRISAPRTFYSWTTDEQVAELRKGGELFSRSERPGMGRGLVFEELDAFAKTAAPEEVGKLAEMLSQSVFAKARFGWINPWATVLGMPGESYGNQLLEIELEPEAWIASFNGKTLTVYEESGNIVPVEQALASPERIGAIFHEAAPDNNTIYCGSFRRSLYSFREFVLGNLQMVKQWSLATDAIKKRLTTDIDALSELRQHLDCLGAPSPGDWTRDLSCQWNGEYRTESSLGFYESALSLGSDLYLPTEANLDALLAALKMSFPTGAPLTVTPSK